MGNLYLRGRIPDGSTMSISIVEGDGTPPNSFIGSARLLLEDGTEVIWDDPKIHPGPKTLKLVSPKNYTWRVRVEFPSAEVRTAVLHATITKPDGAIFSTPYEFEMEGSKGDIVRATIVAMTLLNA